MDATFQEIDAAVLAGAPPASTAPFGGEPRSFGQLLVEPAVADLDAVPALLDVLPGPVNSRAGSAERGSRGVLG
ncbi:hypothetical protein [Actinoalloteichus spitiensis]|uniref:hypothetical protein n=1 Tax=Actinoalloteichus spitiensis TaxID=252394 RepID=UPI00037554AC|nr:hypothetical protein [Actinoalloteichus spitiensis]